MVFVIAIALFVCNVMHMQLQAQGRVLHVHHIAQFEDYTLYSISPVVMAPHSVVLLVFNDFIIICVLARTLTGAPNAMMNA